MRQKFWVALGCIVGIAVLYRTFVTTWLGQEVDQEIMLRLGESPAGWEAAASWVGAIIAPVVAVTAVALLLLAVVRRGDHRYRAALLVLAGSMATSEVLKRALPRPGGDDGSLTNSFPSGHVTAIAAVVVVGVMLAPVGLRALVAWSGSLAVAVAGLAVVILQWHRPSDAAAAVLVAVGWGAVASVQVRAQGRPRPVEPARPRLRTT